MVERHFGSAVRDRDLSISATISTDQYIIWWGRRWSTPTMV